MYKRAAEFIKRHNRFLIASHASPDGDAIGSTLALGMSILSLGKQATMFNVDGVPRNLKFLPYSDKIVRNLNGGMDHDALILVDCAQPRRAGKPVEEIAQKLSPFYIDHHQLPGIRREEHCIDSAAAATGAVIFNLLRYMGQWISPEIAKLLYSTLVVDTGFFRYSNTSPEVFHLAAELVKGGADPWETASQLEENYSSARFVLLRFVLETLETTERGRFATVILTQEMLKEAHALPEDAEEFVNFPRAIAGVEVAALFREQERRCYKVSLRSKGEIDVAAICALFDGGGHEHAAGCTIEADLAAVRKKIADEVSRALQRRFRG